MLNFSIVFPGQGSQSIGMLSRLAPDHPIIEQTFRAASEVTGFDCWDIAQNGPETLLNQTAYTQPILLAADIALWRVYLEQCPTAKPAWLAGHSLGEYAALVASKAMSFEDGIKVVAERGRLMQSAVLENSTGCMAAILGLEDPIIKEICDEVTASNEDKQFLVAPANYNSIGQTVIAGHPQAVAKAIELMKEKGAKRAIALPVSVPSHCALMQSAADELSKLLETIEIQAPQIPVLHNSDVQTHTDANEIRRILCEQLVQPVRWVETVQKLAEHQVQNLIECGPGKVLSGLIKRIDSQLRVYSIDTPEGLSEVICLK